MSSFRYQDVFEQPNKQPPRFRKLSGDFVSTTKVNDKEVLQVGGLFISLTGIVHLLFHDLMTQEHKEPPASQQLDLLKSMSFQRV